MTKAGQACFWMSCRLFCCFVPGYARSVSGAFNISIFPCADAANSFRKFHPLVSYLQHAAGLKISLLFHEDSAGFERALKNGSLDFVIQDPMYMSNCRIIIVTANILQALTFDQKATQTGVVIVRKDSGLKRIMDLKGKTVMFGSKLSSPRWIAARHLFEKNGPLLRRELPTLRRFVNHSMAQEYVLYVMIVDNEGQIVMHSDLKYVGKNVSLYQLEPLAPHLDLSAPVQIADALLGNVFLCYSYTAIENEIRTAVKQIDSTDSRGSRCRRPHLSFDPAADLRPGPG